MENGRPGSAQSAEESTISISVKVPSGETIPMTLPTSTSIPTLLQLLSLRTSLPTTTLRLTHAGRAIYTPSTTTAGAKAKPKPKPAEPQPEPKAEVEATASPSQQKQEDTKPAEAKPEDAKPKEPPTLASLGLAPDATLTLAHPPVRTTPRKIRCGAKECRAVAQRIVGDCGFCGGHFCGNHRMLEDHRCAGLEDCKNQSREQNKVKLESERTVMLRGI